uniref:Uncharacterized protein n=1 Tax=Bactrocera dorsalis TaxID=27457 RepID=A0A034VZU5_BACDO
MDENAAVAVTFVVVAAILSSLLSSTNAAVQNIKPKKSVNKATAADTKVETKSHQQQDNRAPTRIQSRSNSQNILIRYSKIYNSSNRKEVTKAIDKIGCHFCGEQEELLPKFLFFVHCINKNIRSQCDLSNMMLSS